MKLAGKYLRPGLQLSKYGHPNETLLELPTGLYTAKNLLINTSQPPTLYSGWLGDQY